MFCSEYVLSLCDAQCYPETRIRSGRPFRRSSRPSDADGATVDYFSLRTRGRGRPLRGPLLVVDAMKGRKQRDPCEGIFKEAPNVWQDFGICIEPLPIRLLPS